ncbi:MAG: hypothetical protein NTX61_14040 [Bacteroidetes bacterium]|nr:hypothetical protein [Bacteroidota bacterium]
MGKFLLSFLFTLCLIPAGFSQSITSGGTDFWLAFPRNHTSASTLEFFITSEVATSETLSSAYPGVNQAFTVVPGTVTTVYVPSGIALQDSVEDKGIHIVSNDPISVIGHNSLPTSADSYLALPVNALGTDYWIASRSRFTPGAVSSFSVVSTQDGTILTIHNRQNGITYYVNLNMGQTYIAQDSTQGDNLTGSRVQSNHPVAVFGSDPWAKVSMSCGSEEHLVEQMFPYVTWGRTFPNYNSAGRDIPPAGTTEDMRILAAEDNTIVYEEGIYMATIPLAGHWFSYGSAGPFWMTTSKPALMIQCAEGHTCAPTGTGDPFMMQVTPAEQYLKSYTIYSIPGYSQHWVNVMVDSTALGTVYQDGTLIPTAIFMPCSALLYYGARIQVTEGIHTFTSTHPFGVAPYGWGTNVTAYGYPGGSDMARIVDIDTVLLTPAVAYGTLNVSTLCFTAHVIDSLSNPIPSALLTFHIRGLGTINETAYTDANGYAQYCYSRTGTTEGTDSISVECAWHKSDTSLAIWSLTPPCINPTDGGSIGTDQSGCGNFTPLPLTSILHPSGQMGTLEYKWQQSITSATIGFIDIAGTNTPGYSPGVLTQTTWYRRLARVDCLADWSTAVSSNVVEITVTPGITPFITILADHTEVCAEGIVTLTASASGGGSAPVYHWKVNSGNVGTNSNIYSYAPVNGDAVTCEYTSSDPCAIGNPAISNSIILTVDPNLPVSVTISASENPFCSGSTVTFSATPTNGGSSPSYQWKVNGGGVYPDAPTMSYIPSNGDIVTCVLTSSNTVCISNNPATSNAISMVVTPLNPVSVTISTPDNPFCQGSTVSFTATPTNGGTTPIYLWKVNGIGVGSNNPVYSYIPANGDLVTCVVNSTIACPAGNPAPSNTITMAENTVNPVSIVISTPATTVCSGTSVIFTATPTNGGTLPGYQWKVNGITTGPNNPVFIYTPVNGDCITCILTSNLVCASGNPATSNSICMTVNPNLPVNISISTPVTTVCTGTQVTFTATPTHPGTSPLYQWLVNGTGGWPSAPTMSYIPNNGDQVSCVLTSNATCPTGNPATSNIITMTVNANMPVSISINASVNPVCSGIPVTFTATPTNGGSSPVFQWKVNGINAGTNSSTYQYLPVNGDVINCTLTSNLTCTSGNPATGNTITMAVASVPIVTFTRCNDSITTVNAQPFRLKGGLPLGGTYSGPGVTNGIFYPAIAGVGTKTITYSYTNAALCNASASRSLVIGQSSLVVCGNNMTDIRDAKVYPTVQIGSQCWLAANLNYGFMIPGNMSQRDNCIAEKYCLNDITANCQLGTANYQWDELMQYDETLSTQGLCPPGWHIPTESDWNTLFTVYINSAFAAWPLLFTGYSGFNATLAGTRHMNVTWDWSGFATMFWSSTSHGQQKAWAHGMNGTDPSVSLYPALRSNAFSVRCLKDN